MTLGDRIRKIEDFQKVLAYGLEKIREQQLHNADKLDKIMSLVTERGKGNE